MSDKILDLFFCCCKSNLQCTIYGQWIHKSVCIKSISMDLESEPVVWLSSVTCYDLVLSTSFVLCFYSVFAFLPVICRRCKGIPWLLSVEFWGGGNYSIKFGGLFFSIKYLIINKFLFFILWFYLASNYLLFINYSFVL